MRLPETFRSLPRPSSVLKPSYPPYRVVPTFLDFYKHNVIGFSVMLNYNLVAILIQKFG